MLNAHQLGACLYVPATHPHLAAIARGDKLAHVRSLIYCTEDSVAQSDVPHALEQLQALLAVIPADCPRNRFIRLRNPQVMRHILELAHIEKIHGFVLPKITAANIGEYGALRDTPFQLMPTLESRDVFMESAMLALRDVLERDWRERILCLRIGGNDLLNHLHMRRPPGVTLYHTPLGSLIDRLVGVFKPYGYHLSAPVFEFLNQPELLAQEVREDLHHGLTGKTAIHPDQIAIIEQHYRVSREARELAAHILADDADAVFQLNNTMQEPATHRNWAIATLQAAAAFPESDTFWT